MSAPPLIGITAYPADRADRYTLPAAYVASLRRAGAEVIIVPPGLTDGAALLARLDGLVLSGGGDLDPSRFVDGVHETVYGTDTARDDDECGLITEVLSTRLPTLAICRGSQVLNVALGGSLHLHLPDLPTTEQLHRIEPAELRGMPAPTPHAVAVEPDSLIARVMGATEVTPMSWHHQAIDRLGAGLRVVARAPDGTVEATEHESHPWLCSVQWHPELTAHEDPTQQRLFDRLVDACRSGGTP